jgi:hypothetical protein
VTLIERREMYKVSFRKTEEQLAVEVRIILKLKSS